MRIDAVPSAPLMPTPQVLGVEGLNALTEWQRACFGDGLNTVAIHTRAMNDSDIACEGIQRVLQGVSPEQAYERVGLGDEGARLGASARALRIQVKLAFALSHRYRNNNEYEEALSVAAENDAGRDPFRQLLATAYRNSVDSDITPFSSYVEANDVDVPGLFLYAAESTVQHEDSFVIQCVEHMLWNLARYDQRWMGRIGIDKIFEKWAEQTQLAANYDPVEQVPELLQARRWFAADVRRSVKVIFDSRGDIAHKEPIVDAGGISNFLILERVSYLDEKHRMLQTIKPSLLGRKRTERLRKILDETPRDPQTRKPTPVSTSSAQAKPRASTRPAPKETTEQQLPPPEIGYMQDIVAFWELEGGKIPELKAVNAVLVKGDRGDQGRWVVESIGPDAAKRALRLIRQVAAMIDETSAIQTQQAVANSRAMEVAFGDRLKRMARVTPPPALLGATLTSLLGKDGEKWPDMQAMLKDKWPKNVDVQPDWDVVGEVLQGNVQDQPRGDLD